MDINRKTAYNVLLDIETKSAYSNLALNHHIKINKPTSPAFVRELVYGVLENNILLDYILDNFVQKGIQKAKPSDRIILRMGIYQLGYMNSVPEYAAVNESVILAKKFSKGREGFINGVLRAYLRKKSEIVFPDMKKEPEKYLSVMYSCKPWIVRLWMEQYGFEVTEKILMDAQGNPGLSIRVNSILAGRQELAEKLTEAGYEVLESVVCDRGLKILKGGNILEEQYYKEGLFSVQDESSMKTVEILDPKAGDFLIDVCAAPGGKTLAAAERMSGRGKILSCDVYPRKLKQLKEEAERLRIGIVDTMVWDATKANLEFEGKADVVIADVPCSGLGVIRRKPEIKFKDEPSGNVENLPEKQMSILRAAAKYVKDNGILQYSTCTINKKENQEVIKNFLEINKEYKVLKEHQFMPHIDGTDGFYVCKMVKAGEQ